MKNHQNRFTLGSLLRIIALLALFFGAIVAYNKWELKTHTETIESFLIDAKVRVEDALALEDDTNITIREAVNKALESAKKIDESIIQLKKLDQSAVKEHQEKALGILLATGDFMRTQSTMNLNHAENRFQLAKLEPMLAEITTGKSPNDLSAVEQSSIAEIRAKLGLLKANFDVFYFERLQATSHLVDATNEAKHLFSEKSLINTVNYQAAIQELDRFKSAE